MTTVERAPRVALAGAALAGFLTLVRSPAQASPEPSVPGPQASVGSAARTTTTATPAPGPAAPRARDGYSQSLSSLNEQSVAFEQDPQNHYTYCIRTIGTYECLSYGVDGNVKKAHPVAVAHGTGVAYQQLHGETYILTNQHVAEWPVVTDANHTAGDVPSGCKLLSSTLKIVDNESDDYAADDIPLTEVVADLSLDSAILKAKILLRTMPYRMGKSSALRVGDAVVVKGFPLGVFRAITTGQVINTYNHDDIEDWDHDDFIIDAPLSEGNSGSPVLAISQRTGDYEFVGLFHAIFIEGHGLNAVISVEQLRDLMTTLKKTPRANWADKRSGPQARADFLKALAKPAFVPYLRLGPRVVEVRTIGDRLVFAVYSPDFPRDGWRDLLLIDSPDSSAFGAPATVLVGGASDFGLFETSALDAPSQTVVANLARRLHALATETVRLRNLRANSSGSREALSQFEQYKREASRNASGDADLVEGVDGLVEALRGKSTNIRYPLDVDWALLAAPVPPAPGAASGPRGASDQPADAVSKTPEEPGKTLPAPIESPGAPRSFPNH